MVVPPERGIALGTVQGATEFLPVSSSAHLILVPWLAGWADEGLVFDVALHLGTLLAVAWYFRREWWRLATGAVASAAAGRLAANPEARLFWQIAAASVPAAAAGAVLEEAVAHALRAPLLIAVTLVVFGALLYLSDRRPGARGARDLSWRDALWIGAAQALAIVPGVSRSGVTITAARFLDLDRETSARFSFLMSLPITAGAVLLKSGEIAVVASDPGLLLAVGASALSGFAAIAGLIRYVRVRSYAPFVIYRAALAVVIVAVLVL